MVYYELLVREDGCYMLVLICVLCCKDDVCSFGGSFWLCFIIMEINDGKNECCEC